MLNFETLFGSHYWSRGHDFNNLENTLVEGAQQSHEM